MYAELSKKTSAPSSFCTSFCFPTLPPEWPLPEGPIKATNVPGSKWPEQGARITFSSWGKVKSESKGVKSSYLDNMFFHMINKNMVWGCFRSKETWQVSWIFSALPQWNEEGPCKEVSSSQSQKRSWVDWPTNSQHFLIILRLRVFPQTYWLRWKNSKQQSPKTKTNSDERC